MIGKGISDRAAALQRIQDLESQLAAAQAEIEKLKIVDKYRTTPTPWLIADYQRLREALEKMVCNCMDETYSKHKHEDWCHRKISQSALYGGKA